MPCQWPLTGTAVIDDAPPLRLLVAVASRHGATAELAQAVAEGARAALPPEAQVVVRRCSDLIDVRRFDGVVIGSAVYFGHWLEEADDFALLSAIGLWGRPVWLFSSGPVGVPARPPGVLIDISEIQQLSHAREHRVFGGRIDRAHLNFAERALVVALLAPEGDFRPWREVRSWGAAITRALVEAQSEPEEEQ